jgi:hypothetical protein
MSEHLKKRRAGGKQTADAKSKKLSGFTAEVQPTVAASDYPTRSLRAEIICGASAAAFSAAVYFPTTAPAITLLDAADFALGAQTLGVVHPPGFPLYTVLGFIFSKLPLGLDPAHQMHLFSAFAAVCAVGVLAAALRLAIGHSLAAFLGAAAFALTGAMWSQAVIAECYALHALLLAIMFYFVLIYRRSMSNRALAGLAVTTGLALANHYPLTMLTACGFLPLIPFRRMTPKSLVWSSAVTAVFIVVPYAYLFIQSSRIDKLAYAFGPMVDWPLVIDWILRSKYASVDQAGGGFVDKMKIFGFLTGSIFRDYLLFSAIAVWGIVSLWRHERMLAISALFASIGGLLILCVMLGFRATPPWYDVSYAYAHSFFMVVSLPVAAGARQFLMYKKFPVAVAALTMFLALLVQGWFTFPKVSQHNNYAVRDWAHALLNSLAKDATLIALGDDVMPLYYTQFNEGVRPDVTIMDRYGLVTKKKLFSYDPHEDVDVKARYLAEKALVQSRDKAVYYTGQLPGLESMGGKSVNLGLVYRVNAPEEKFLQRPDGTPEGIKPTEAAALLSQLSRTYPRDEMFMNGFRRQNFIRLTSFARSKGTMTIEEVNTALTKENFEDDVLLMADFANEFIIAGLAQDALAIFDRIKTSVKELPTGNLRSYCQLLINMGRRDEAKAVCQLQLEKSEKCDPDPRYNLGVAHWNDREKSVKYLKSAVLCKKDFQPAIDLLLSLGEKP